MKEETQLTVTRGDIILRGIRCRCPNCGERGLLASWFRLGKACESCGMDLARSAGIYSGTTSIGYVAAIICILIPDFIMVYNQVLSVAVGITLGLVGSFAFIVLIYPVMLCWMVMAYHVALPGELPANGGRAGQGDGE